MARPPALAFVIPWAYALSLLGAQEEPIRRRRLRRQCRLAPAIAEAQGAAADGRLVLVGISEMPWGLESAPFRVSAFDDDDAPTPSKRSRCFAAAATHRRREVGLAQQRARSRSIV